MIEDLKITKTIVMILALALLMILESVIPFFEGRKDKWWHDLRNIILGIVNIAVVAIVFSTTVFFVQESSFAKTYGLLNLFQIPIWLQAVLAFLLFDLWMYVWHVVLHRMPFLWRFHRMHHSDEMVQATSAFRFHPGEIIISSIGRLAIFAILGIQVWHLLLYEIVMIPVIAFQHSNIALPMWLDKAVRTVIVSPRMHWVHHSEWQPETDSNYGSIFSFWDRLFKTYKRRKGDKEYKKIVQGVDPFKGKKWDSIWGMLKTPFVKK